MITMPTQDYASQVQRYPLIPLDSRRCFVFFQILQMVLNKETLVQSVALIDIAREYVFKHCPHIFMVFCLMKLHMINESVLVQLFSKFKKLTENNQKILTEHKRYFAHIATWVAVRWSETWKLWPEPCLD